MATPRVATSYPFHSEQKSFERPMLFDSLYRIHATSGLVATGRRKQRRYHVLIKPYGNQKQK